MNPEGVVGSKGEYLGGQIEDSGPSHAIPFKEESSLVFFHF